MCTFCENDTIFNVDIMCSYMSNYYIYTSRTILLPKGDFNCMSIE